MTDMTTIARPAERPADPRFSSGPCVKRPGWTPAALEGALLGRSHRAPAGLAKLREALALTREVLQVPATHLIAITPGSDTGAVEMALWNLVGERGVDVAAWESFGKDWVTDVLRELRIDDARAFVAPFGRLPDFSQIDFDRDVVFTWNGTTSGVRLPSADMIPADRAGLTICDATSALFAQPVDWAKLDVVTFSWQKAMGGEAAHGMPIARLERFVPDRPMPKLFRIADKGKVNASFFDGSTINTPSMLCVEDYIDTLLWAKRIGGLNALHARADASAGALYDWVARTPWIDVLAEDPATRSNTGVCLKVVDPELLANDGGAAFCKDLVKRRLRHRFLPRRADGPAHLVRPDRRAVRRRQAHPLARLGPRHPRRPPRRRGVGFYAIGLGV
jgi:phosphoserine aminotransferase